MGRNPRTPPRRQGRYRDLALIALLAVSLLGCASRGDTRSSSVQRSQSPRVVDPLDPTGNLSEPVTPTVPPPRSLPTEQDRSRKDATGIHPVRSTTFRKPAGSARSLPTASLNRTPQVQIVAIVGRTDIYEHEVREAVSLRFGEFANLSDSDRQVKEAEIYEEELSRLIERELILHDLTTKLEENAKHALEHLQEAAMKEADKRLAEQQKRMRLPDQQTLGKYLSLQGLTLKGLRRHIARNFMMMQYLRNLIHPKVDHISLREIRAYYEQHPQEFQTQDRVKWQDIFLRVDNFASWEEARQHAEHIRQQALQGANFATLANKFDQGDSVFRNGYGLGELPGEIRPAELESILLSLKTGQIGPLIEIDSGIHIVRVDERQYAGRRPFNVATQEEVRRKLRQQVSEREHGRLINELRRKTPIVLYQR